MLGPALDQPPYTPVGGTYFSINQARRGTTAVNIAAANAASLTSNGHAGNDTTWFNGMIVSNNGAYELQLTYSSGDANTTHYVLMRRNGGPNFDYNVCGDGGDALPIAGVFTADARHIAQPGSITFACSNGDAHKCIDWGYSPPAMWDAYQACTRMARDDIRGNGISHTHLDTMIAIRDVVGVNPAPTNANLGVAITTWPPDPDALFFEAAWGVKGAVCLGRRRWSDLPPGGYPGLPDPRQGNGAKNCEDEDVASLVARGALLFNASHVNDAAQLRWRTSTPDGDDYVSTIRGYYSTVSGQATAPFADYHTYTYVGIDGFLLRAIPGSITVDDLTLVRLYRERSNSRIVLAKSFDPVLDVTHYEPFPDPEGYLFTTYRDGLVAFGMFYNPTTGDYFSTTMANALPTGYVSAGLIGWTFPPDQL